MRITPYHPCIGGRCARRDGITCADDACDLDLAIYTPGPGEITAEQAAYIRAAGERREDLARGRGKEEEPCPTE